MGQQTKRLSTTAVSKATQPGRHADGAGLYLIVDPSGAKRWLFLFRWQGKLKERGLGGYKDGLGVTLAEARERAAVCRSLLRDGINPIEAARAEADRKVPTFGEVADAFVETKGPQWRNVKHRAQWKATLTGHAAAIRDKRVDQVGTDDVLRVLKPIWLTRPETASRLRGRIERVLDAARAGNHRTGENPARWRGHLDHLLPARSKVRKVKHHDAVPYAEMPAFMAELQQLDSVSARALEFLILTAARTGEAAEATWPEIDLDKRVWTVPGERMKAGKEHKVPLSDRAIEILTALPREGEYLFPGGRAGRPLSNMAMLQLLRGMRGMGATVHGFRSSFKDWVSEKTAYPNELTEMALAHTIANRVEAAYRRGDLLERRREMMDAWQRFCDGISNIVPLRQPA